MRKPCGLAGSRTRNSVLAQKGGHNLERFLSFLVDFSYMFTVNLAMVSSWSCACLLCCVCVCLGVVLSIHISLSVPQQFMVMELAPFSMDDGELSHVAHNGHDFLCLVTCPTAVLAHSLTINLANTVANVDSADRQSH